MNTRWLDRLSRLRVDRDSEKGPAPHKPLLILAVLDLLEAGELRDGVVTLSPDLILRFQNFWPIVAPRRGNRGDIRMPFHALGNDQLWATFDREGRPSRSRETSLTAVLDADLAAAFIDEVFRKAARRTLIATYFPPMERVALAAAIGLDGPISSDPSGLTLPEFRRARESGRDARFKNAVVGGYRFTCALTGYRLVTADQGGIVEAAHIHALSSSRNNDPDNGLALTPTAHALFDRGVWSVDESLRIVVRPASAFIEESPPGGFSLRALAGRPLHFAREASLRPARTHFAWHRRQHGFA